MLYETGTRDSGVGGAVGPESPKGILIPPTPTGGKSPGAVVVGVTLGCPGVMVGVGAAPGGGVVPGTVGVALLLGAVAFVETGASVVGGPESEVVVGKEVVFVAVGAPGGNDVVGDAPSGVAVGTPGRGALAGAVVAVVLGPDVAPGAVESLPGEVVVVGPRGAVGLLLGALVVGVTVMDA
jgi:hypothetical protein